MKRNISKTTLIIAAFLTLPFSACATPDNLDMASDEIRHGQNVTVTGSGFGAKAIAQPKFFNDMENETVGQIPSDQMTNTLTTGHGLTRPNIAHSSDKSLEFNYSASSSDKSDWQRNMFDLGGASDKVYFSVWIYLDKGDSVSSSWQWKSFTLTSSSEGYYDLSPTYPSQVWVDSNTYSHNSSSPASSDKVTYGGKTYICTSSVTTTNPANPPPDTDTLH